MSIGRRHIRTALLCGVWVCAAAGSLSAAELPARPVNLIVGSDFETDANADGVPDGWFHSEPQHWSGPAENSAEWQKLRDLWVAEGGVPERIPFRPPKTIEGGAYGWEGPGYQSAHAISIDETTERKWGEWNTVVKGIKAETDYVFMGWRRQSATPGRKPGVSPWLKIAAFGRIIPVRGTLDRGTWVPFVVPVNSGVFKGECNLGFIIEQAPTKVWLDRVVMFRGKPADIPRFRVGDKGAVLGYPLHAAAYASPDLECPLFFDLLWSFHGVEGDAGLKLVIDLPKGLDLTGGECGEGLKLGVPGLRDIAVEGRPYVRMTFPIPSAKGRKQFDSAGRRSVRLWLETKLEAGTFDLYYRAAWNRGSQPGQRLAVRVIRIPRVQSPTALLAGLGTLSPELVASRAHKLVKVPAGKDLAGSGINCLLLAGGLDAKVGARFDKAGISLGARFDLVGDLPAAAVAKDSQGNPVPGLICPSYRSADMIRTVFAGPARLVGGGTATLVADLRDGRRRICFCERCVKDFQAFVTKQKPGLKYVPPAQFVAEPEKHRELEALWHEFRSARLADLYWTLRKQLDRFRKEAKPAPPNATMPLRLLARVPAPSRGTEAVRGAMVDYAKLANVFDLEVIQPDMHLADAGGTPAWVGDETARLIRQLPPGGEAGVVITAGSWRSGTAVAPVPRASDVRDQVLEAVTAGAKAVFLEPFSDVDGMDLCQFSEALRMLEPFRDLVDEGEPADRVSAEGTASVRCLAKDDQGLVLVADYSPKPAATVKLAFKIPNNARRTPLALVDVASRKLVQGRILPGDRAVEVPLEGDRARLFYLGPLKKLPFKASK